MKIVAIAGGNNSNIKKSGLSQVYEHEKIDKEIISLTEKKHPNILFISHASDVELQIASYNKLVNTYGKMFSCPIKLLNIEMLENKSLVISLLDWSDVIYVGGGNSKAMMELWKLHGFDKLLKDCCNDKILCGISAGANCWFKYSCSDYLQMETNNPELPFMPLEGLGLINLAFNPHANYTGRLDGMKSILRTIHINGLSLSNNMAIEFIDEKYKLIEGISSNGKENFALLGYWSGEKYHTERISNEGTIKQLILRR